MYKSILFSAFLFSLILFSKSFANTYYVDATSSNCDPNITSQPWQSFACFNINLLPNGSTIYVEPGTYSIGHSTYNNSIIRIISRTSITIAKDPNSTGEVIFEGNYNIDYGIRISPATSTTMLNNYIIKGITFQHFLVNGVKLRGGNSNKVDGVTVQDCKFINNGTQSILVQLTNNVHLLRNNIEQIKVLSTDPNVGDGIQIGDNCSAVTVDSNLIKVQYNPSTSDHVDCIQIAKATDPIIDNPYSYDVNITRNKCYMLTDNNGPDRSGIIVSGVLQDLHIYNNLVISSGRYNLINVIFYDFTNLKIYNNTLVGLTSPSHVLYLEKTGKIPNIFEIKNNIFYKNSDEHTTIAAVFVGCEESELNLNRMSNNLFYNNACPACSLQISIGNSAKEYNYYDREAGLLTDPNFISNEDIFKLEYYSPAINTGSFFDEITTDVEGNKRPYWPISTDIGAYEYSEATLKIGHYDILGSVTHTISALGTFWKKDGSNWAITTDPSISTGDYTISENITDKEAWDGFRFKWLLNSDEVRPMGHAFYKISTSNTYFYLDLREITSSYNPNMFIRYTRSGVNYFYQYWSGSGYTDIGRGSILRVWELGGTEVLTTCLPDYFNHMLIDIVEDNHPLLVWGPVRPPQIEALNIMRYHDPDWSILQTIEPYPYKFKDLSVDLEANGDRVRYYLSRGTCQTCSSNVVDYTGKVSKANQLVNILPTFNLIQNYPNPFNPSTVISFSISKEDRVVLRIYDILGKEIQTIINEKLNPGDYKVEYNGKDLASGVYFYSLSTGSEYVTRKMQLIK